MIVGERTVVRAERQREGNALLPFRDTDAGVDVEELHAAQDVLFRLADTLGQLADGNRSVAHDGNVARDGREARQRRIDRLRTLEIVQQHDVDLGAVCRAVEPVGSAHVGVDLAERAEARIARPHRGAAAGMERGGLRVGGEAHVRRAGGAQQRLHRALEREEVHIAAVSAEREHGALVGQHLAGLLLVHGRHFIELRFHVAAAEVRGQHAEHGGQRRRAHDARILAERIEDAVVIAQRGVGGYLDLIKARRADERIRHDLGIAHGAAGRAELPDKERLFAVAALRGCAADVGGFDLIVAPEAGALLGDVGEHGAVAAPGGGGERIAVELKAERGERIGHELARDIGAEQGVDALVVQLDERRLRLFGEHVDRTVEHLARAEHFYELARAVDRRDGGEQVEALFKPAGGVRAHAEGDGRFADGVAEEVGALENDGRRFVGDLAVRAAHHARERDGALRVGNDEHAGRESVVVAVERPERFALFGAADDDLAVVQAGVIERVHRLAVLEHDVVRDIDDVVDRAHAGRAQTAAHPLRRRGDLDIFHHARGVARAELRVLDLHGELFMDIAVAGSHRGLGKRQRRVECAGALAGKSAHGKAVGAVVRDLKLHDAVVETADLADIVAGDAVLFEDENAVLDRVREVALLKPQLAERAEHALAELAAQLAGADLLAAGQRAAVERDGDEIADVDVLRAGDDLELALAADVDLADPHVVGVRVALHGDHTPDDNAGNFAAGDLPALYLGAGQGHRVAVFLIGGADGRIFPQPFSRKFHVATSLKLGQEPGVVFVQQAHVADLEAAHDETLETDAEREAGVDRRVDAAHFEHARVYHAGAEQLDPALTLAHAAALAVALKALHVHLAARLGEREVVRTEAGHGIGTVELFHQGVERALEIAHRDALVDDKALDLVEHRGMGRVDLVLAVHAARG